MLPIERLEPAEARNLKGLLFDLDDTFLDHGRLDAAAYAALFRLREAGLELVVVTGRPAGWGEVLARQWPVLGVITENGAIAFARRQGRLEQLDSVSAGERAGRRESVRQLAAELRREFPELVPADDNAARVSDFTFDIGEHRRVAPEVVAQAQRHIRRAGARTTHSSVHLHLTFDTDDKASGAVRFLHEQTGVDATVARSTWAYIGDSENDAACFAAFHTTLGVANLSGRPTLRPRFLTPSPRSSGFLEAATHLITARA